MRPGESARIKSEFHWYVTTQFARWRLCRELEELNGIAWKGQVRDAAGLAKHPAETRRLLTAIRELGCVGLTDGDIDRLLQGDEKVMKIRKGRYSPQIAYTGEGEARIAWLRERGFYLTGYGPYGNSGIGGYDECPQYWAGEAAATPATDGRYVFALTTARTLAAFSLDGKAAWSVQLPADHPKRLFDILCSPLYHDGIVIVVTSAGTFGVDATNGQLRYTNTDSAQGGYADPPPVFLTVDGDRYVAHANGCIMHATSGRTALARVWATQSHSTWTSHGDTVYLVVSGQDGAWKGRADTLFAKEAGAAVQAIRFTRAGDGLEAERLWRLRGEKRGSLVYHDGLVFGVINVGQDRKGTTVLAAIDAETGEVLAQHPVLEGIDSQGKARGGVALGAWHLDVAGGHLFTSDGGFRSRGMVSVLRADRSLAIVSRCNLLRGHGYDPQRFARYPRWGRFTEMFPTLFSGNRIFIRCFDALYCLGSGPLRLSAHHR